MRHLVITLFLLILFPVEELAAESSRIRLGGDFGLGAALVSVDGIDRTESPTAFAINTEYSYSSYLTLGVEHFRTIVNDNGISTAVGFSGLFFKYYPFQTIRAQVMPTDTWFTEDEIIYKSYSIYVGGGLGVGQSSLRALTEQQKNRTISVGIYGSGKVGIEKPIRGSFGSYAEFSVALTFAGTGTIFFPRLTFGLYYFI